MMELSIQISGGQYFSRAVRGGTWCLVPLRVGGACQSRWRPGANSHGAGSKKKALGQGKLNGRCHCSSLSTGTFRSRPPPSSKVVEKTQVDRHDFDFFFFAVGIGSLTACVVFVSEAGEFPIYHLRRLSQQWLARISGPQFLAPKAFRGILEPPITRAYLDYAMPGAYE